MFAPLFGKFALLVRIKTLDSGTASSDHGPGAASGWPLNIPTQYKEWALILALIVLAGIAFFGPELPQIGGYSRFADQRTWLGLSHASDVLSNIPFALGGLYGFWRLSQGQFREPYSQQVQTRAIASAVFFCGLIATAVGSSWFHFQPSNTGLAIDRLTMVFAFAGLLGLAACERVSSRMGLFMIAITILTGLLSLWYWSHSDNILPWAIVQFGGVAVLVGLSFFKPHGPAVSLVTVIALYTLAKLFEHFDYQVFELTGQLVSGHSMKHLVASLVIFPVLSAPVPSPRNPQSTL